MLRIARCLAVPALILAFACSRVSPPARGGTKAAASEGGELRLSRAGVTPYVITLADSATATEKNAAHELATYLCEITGATFAVVTPPESAGRRVTAVGSGAARAAAPHLDLAREGEKGLGDDGIVIKSVGDH